MIPNKILPHLCFLGFNECSHVLDISVTNEYQMAYSLIKCEMVSFKQWHLIQVFCINMFTISVGSLQYLLCYVRNTRQPLVEIQHIGR